MGRKSIILPEKGTAKAQLETELKEIHSHDFDFEGGKVFAYAYHYTEEHTDLLKYAYNLFFSANALNPMAFPSAKKFESEVVSMCADLFHGDQKVFGNITTGGSESLLMAVKTYRDWARKEKPEIKHPEMIVPESAHPALSKAAHYFDVTIIYIPLDKNGLADVNALKKALSPNTILVVGSACEYPRGGVDPIPEMAQIAMEHGCGFHTDSCVGGFMLPFLKKLGYPNIPEFDFNVPGVTSISADLHKYGLTAKMSSVLLFRKEKTWKNQFYANTEWIGGIYTSPTMPGTRSIAMLAAAWAGMMHLGMEGYCEMAKTTMQTAERLRDGVKKIPGLKVFGQPVMTLFSFGSDEFNVYPIADLMAQRGWVMDRLQKPPALHCIVMPNQANIVDTFLKDLAECTEIVRKNPQKANEGEAAMYGMLTTFKERDKIPEMVLGFLADQFKTKK